MATHTTPAPVPAGTRPTVIGLPAGAAWFPGRIRTTDGQLYRLTPDGWVVASGHVTLASTLAGTR